MAAYCASCYSDVKAKFHAEVKRGRLACEDFVKIETEKLVGINTSLLDTIKKYDEERSAVRDMLLNEMSGVKDRDLTLHQQVAKLANLRHYAEKQVKELRAQVEAMRRVLEKCEWNMSVYDDACDRCQENLTEEQCQICMAHHHSGHKNSCEMFLALAKLDAMENKK